MLPHIELDLAAGASAVMHTAQDMQYHGHCKAHHEQLAR
jgi:hypothetical protein